MKNKKFKKIIDKSIIESRRFYQKQKARNNYRDRESNRNDNNQKNNQSKNNDHATIELKTFSAVYCISIFSFSFFSLQTS